LGEESVEVARTLNNIGSLQMYLGKFELALITLHQCLNIRVKLLGPASQEVTQTFLKINYLEQQLDAKNDQHQG
jgi:hypothetical protein